MPLLTLPRTLAIGDLISYANEKVQTTEGRRNRYTFAGSGYFERMKELGLYILNPDQVKRKIAKLDLDNIFCNQLV